MQNVRLDDLLATLLENKIEFVLIGGFASVVHGCDYVTQDLDICMALTAGNIDLLRNALKDLHPVHKANPAVSFSERPRDGETIQNIYLRTDIGALDVLSSVEPIGSFDALKKRAFSTKIYGHECSVISLDDLIAVKETAGRKKDLIILDELKAIRDRQKK